MSSPLPEREFVITSAKLREWQRLLDEARNAALWWKTEALIAESEPIIAHYASVEAQLAAQNPAPPPEPATSSAGLPSPRTAADAGPAGERA